MGKTTLEILKSIKGTTFFWTLTRAGFGVNKCHSDWSGKKEVHDDL